MSTNHIFLITKFLQLMAKTFDFSNLNCLTNQAIHFLKYQMSSTSGYNDLGISKLGFMIISHPLCLLYVKLRKFSAQCIHFRTVYLQIA